MAVTYATITRAATGPTPKRTFRFYPQTEGNVVTVAAQGYEHVGPFEVTTGAGGTFTIAIPLGTDQGGPDLVWKITETPVDKIPGRQGGPLAAHTIGYVNITAPIGYDDLIANLIDVTVVSPDLVNTVGASAATATAKAAEAAGSAAAALDSAANADSSADLADVSEANAAASASTASTAASTATTKASEASTSAATATTKASEASTSAATATTKASEASTSATNAQGYAASAAGSVSLVAWAPATAYTAGDVRQGPDGTAISRNANGTSRASFDATEEAAWTSVLVKSGTLAQRDLTNTIDGRAYTQGRQRNLREAAGVDPTGATDSSVGLQDAMNEALAAGAPCLLPPGRYKASGLTLDPGNNQDITLEGAGYETVLVPAEDATPVITFNGGSSNTQRQMLRGLTFDLDGKDAPAIRTTGFGQRGTLADLSVFGMGGTYTSAAIELDGPLVSFLIDNVQVKGGGTSVGAALKFFAPMYSGRIRNFRALDVGRGITTDTSTCNGGSDLRIEGSIFEQCTVGVELLMLPITGLTVRDSRFERASSVALDLSGLDTNYRMCSTLLQALYFSGLDSGTIGVRVSKMAKAALEHSSFRAVNGLPFASYPVSTPVSIGTNVAGWRQRGNHNDSATASGSTLVAESVGAMSFSGAFLPSTDITRDQTSSDVPNQNSTTTTVFTSSGTFTRDARAKTYEITVIGGGAGGGSGRRGAAASARCGGGGGGGAQVTRLMLPAAAVTTDVSVTVGTGGAGGAAVTADNTDGNPGTNGAASLFGTAGFTFAKAGGGAAGSGGTATTGAAGSTTSSSGQFAGGAGGAAGSNGAVGSASPNVASGAAGGGGGGGITAADAVSAGGSGGVVGGHASGGAGAAGASAGGAGGNGTDSATSSGIPGPSGGGGGSSITGAGGAGGNGGKYGGGGGGGGASLNGNNSGKGGDGANGIVIVTTYY